jgi:two-component system, sporulation sensor kinase B
MLFVFILLSTVAVVLLISDYQSFNVKLASAYAFVTGLGGLAVVIEENIMPWVQHRFGQGTLYAVALFSDNLFTFVCHYVSPYMYLLFALSYSGLVSRKQLGWIACVGLIPIFLMYLCFPFYPYLEKPYAIASCWTVPYVMTGSYFLIIAYFKEENPFVKRNRFYTNIAIIPAYSYALIANYILRALGIDQLWRLNTLFTTISFGLFLIAIFKHGFADIKLSIQRQRINSSIRAMMAGTAMLNHSLKNDLGKMKLYSYKIQKFARQSGQTELEKDIAIILNTYEHTQATLEQIHRRTKEHPLRLQEHHFIDIIESCLQTLAPLCDRAKVTVTKKYPDIDIHLFCDSSQLTEVFHNLILNAIEAMPNGGNLSIEVLDRNKKIIVVFRDTGVGISKADLTQVLQPFFSTKMNTGKNFGLGLPHCYSIVRKHQGFIDITSKKGIGTTVYLSFPKQSDEKEGNPWKKFLSYWSKMIQTG